MRPEYDGVKFYSVLDWSIGENLEKSAKILESFNENEDYADINKVIELYNVQQLINSGAYLREWDEDIIDHYKKLSVPLTKVLGKFFGKINDENFQLITRSVSIGYVEDYWRLFVKFKVYKKVSGEMFAAYINDPKTTLWILLQQEELVKYYGQELANVLRISEQTPRLVISKFLERHDQESPYHFPKELNPTEYEGILQNYINSDTANLNHLQLLARTQSSGEYSENMGDTSGMSVDAITSASVGPTDNTEGNLQVMAQVIQENTGADVFHIVVSEPYDPEYDVMRERAIDEMDDNTLPALTDRVENIEQYDVIYLGTPVWGGALPQPVVTFLTENDLSGKTIIPFGIHLGSRFGRMLNQIEELCPEATLAEGFTISASTSNDDVRAEFGEWLADQEN